MSTEITWSPDSCEPSSTRCRATSVSCVSQSRSSSRTRRRDRLAMLWRNSNRQSLDHCCRHYLSTGWPKNICHEMFDISTLLLHDELEPATPLTNDAISKTPRYVAPLVCAARLKYIVAGDTPSVEGHSKRCNQRNLILGCLGAKYQARWK